MAGSGYRVALLLAGFRNRTIAGLVGSRGGSEALERSANDARSDLSPAAAS